jgi:hypothetical protein
MSRFNAGYCMFPAAAAAAFRTLQPSATARFTPRCTTTRDNQEPDGCASVRVTVPAKPHKNEPGRSHRAGLVIILSDQEVTA